MENERKSKVREAKTCCLVLEWTAHRCECRMILCAEPGGSSPGLRIPWVLALPNFVRGHEAAEGGGVVASAEVVEARFGVAFFAGEFVGHRHMLDEAIVHECQCVVGVEGIVEGSSTTLKVTSRSVAWNFIASFP